MSFDILDVHWVEGEEDTPVKDEDLYELSKLAIDTCYVEHTNFDSVLKNVLGRIARNGRKSSKQRSILVAGHSDAGKTTLVTKILEAYPRVEDARRLRFKNGSSATCDHVPVIAIDCPDVPQPTRILRHILRKMGDPLIKKRKTRDDLETAVWGFLRALGTVALVVDEAQRPTDREGKLIQRSIATLFQQIHDQGVIVVLVGLGRARALLTEDVQVGNRWCTPLRIDAYRWGDPAIGSGSAGFARVPPAVRASRAQFKGLIIVIASEVRIEWARDIDFAQDGDGYLVFFSTLGLVGTVKKLFTAAVDIARELGTTVITRAILAEAFERECRSTSMHCTGPNPFYEGFQPAFPLELPDDKATLFPQLADALDGATKGRRKGTRRRMLAEATSR